MNLYDLSLELLQQLSAPGVDTETGECDWTAYEQRLSELEGSWNDKGCAVAKYILNLEAEADARKEAAKRIAEAAKHQEAHAARLKAYLLAMCEKTGQWPSDLQVKVSSRKSKSLQIDDENIIPKNYLKFVQSVDKVAITKAIKDGISVDGAHIVEKVNLQIK
jgi:hypothetical protein